MAVSFDIVKALPLFCDLTEAQNVAVAEKCQLVTVRRGSYLYLHGDMISSFCILCRGVLQLFRETPDGHEVTSEILLAGDCVNADEIVARQGIHRVNARAAEDSLILHVPIAFMRETLTNFDHIGPKLLAGVTDRLHRSQKDAEQSSTMTASQVVACYLQEICVLYGFNPAGFDLPYSKTLIASRLHMELETFSRTLKKLRDVGIDVEGSHVRFTNLNKAGRFVCDNCSMSEDCNTRRALLDRADDLADAAPILAATRCA